MSTNETPLKNWTVLVVEDDFDSAGIARMLLERAGAVVEMASNGKDGIRKAEDIQPDFILTDIAMPILDGWKMIERLKENRATADIPIIALTAYGDFGDRERAFAAGCHNFLSKPLTPDTFVRDLVSTLVDVPELASHFGS